MASTPSASALSAVLRCRGNIWTRNPPAKRPASSAYGLGLAGGALRDSPGERSGSHQASAAEASPHGECVAVLVGRGLTVSYRSHRVGGKVSREVRRSGSSPDEAPRHLLCQRDEKKSSSRTLQANEQTSSKNNSSLAQKITQEGPD